MYTAFLEAMNRTGIRYVIGGALAVFTYTGIWRDTKDMDVFLQPHDLYAALTAAQNVGFETEVRDRCWLAKAHCGEYFVDLIFGLKNQHFEMDDLWFESSKAIEIMGTRSRLVCLEDLIASKVHIAMRDRFDGADIAHLIRSVKGDLDWQRLLDRLGEDRDLLLWHLILFNFAYPGHAEYLPKKLMKGLFEEITRKWNHATDLRFCRGVLLDETSFEVDWKNLGYAKARHTKPLVDKTGKKL